MREDLHRYTVRYSFRTSSNDGGGSNIRDFACFKFAGKAARRIRCQYRPFNTNGHTSLEEAETDIVARLLAHEKELEEPFEKDQIGS